MTSTRIIYCEQLEQGIPGDDAAAIAHDENLRIELARLVANQPAHNSPIALEQLLHADDLARELRIEEGQL